MKTVNFIEAVNSGKRFRLPDSQIWYFVDDNGYVKYKNNGYSADVSDHHIIFINSQFELEEKKITITESEFDKAYDEATREPGFLRTSLKKELGF